MFAASRRIVTVLPRFQQTIATAARLRVVAVPLAVPAANASRGFHCSALSCSALRTKQAAAKRFKKKASGALKYTHANKSHLNGKKSSKRMRRLNEKVTATNPLPLPNCFWRLVWRVAEENAEAHHHREVNC
eukprot:scaffold5636_cov159-Ochromonas_danica.AAC.19